MKRSILAFSSNGVSGVKAVCLRLWVLFFLTSSQNKNIIVLGQQQQDPLTMNGGSVLAMAGKNCVAVAVDKRFGSGPALVQVVPRPPLLVASPTLVVAWTGLQGDVQSMQQDLAIQLSRTTGIGFSWKTKSFISPKSLASLTSHILYNRKRAPYYVEPLVVGLERTVNEERATRHDENESSKAASSVSFRPYLCSLDMIGAQSVEDSFVCAGAATKSLYGTAEALWRPDVEPQELVKMCGEAFLTALERDCLSGYGALVYLITGDGIEEYDLDTRND